MDPDRFDGLTRSLAASLAAPASRRRAFGLFAAGGLVGGWSQARPAVAAQRTTCTMELVTTVRLGPSSGVHLTGNGAQPGEARGQLTFGLTGDGALTDGVFLLTDGTALPVVGQATGTSLQIRIAAGPDLAIVTVGVGEQEVAACQGTFSGIAAGPAPGDLGDWQAVAQGQGSAAGGSGGSGGRVQMGGNRPSQAGQPRGRPPGRGSGSGGSTGRPNNPAPSVPPQQGTCPADLTLCDDACVDLSSDLEHCGACGEVCESQLVPVRCRDGVCERASCEVGIEYCGAVDGCRDLASDPDHCGACGTACPAGETCLSGICGTAINPIECLPEETDCDGECVDLRTDNLNCGVCGEVCELGDACTNGACAPMAPTCDAGLTGCGGICVDLTTDPLHCGACLSACPDGDACTNGVCVPAGGFGCIAPLVACGELCVDPNTDPLHCGACGVACLAVQTCTNGVCIEAAPAPAACPPGQENCFGVCTDVSNDANNCGACGIPCGPGLLCQANVCVAGAPACAAGLTACGGVCLNLLTDPFACGACTNVCGDGEVCQAGVCTPPGVN